MIDDLKLNFAFGNWNRKQKVLLQKQKENLVWIEATRARSPQKEKLPLGDYS